MSIWKIKKSVSPSAELIEKYGEIIAKLLMERGITDLKKADAFFLPDYQRDIHDPFLFVDMVKIMERLKTAIDKKQKIVVYGDYDADGVTSSVILKETLTKIGLDCEVYIPDKKSEGYGLNIKALEEFLKKKIRLILTVDCGITSVKEVKMAKQLGMDVIIIDHHYVPKEYPEALIINPQMEKCGYPKECLAGVGVTLKVVQAIYRTFIPDQEEQSKWLLDLVAIGTVADSVPLKGENRAIVKFGQIVLSKTRRIGLQEMFNVGRIKIDENNFPDVRKIAFQISPRINAAGRMNHANAAFNLLIERDRIKARMLALDLEDSNLRRQKETERVFKELKEIAEKNFAGRKIIFAVGEHYPIGIVGLVAGKIMEEFGKPAIILQKEQYLSKGSIRSVEGINIMEVLEECSELLQKFGGHVQAAGLTIKNENIEAFLNKAEKIIGEKTKDLQAEKIIEAECEIEADLINYELVRKIEMFSPFGEGNKMPIFMVKNMIVKKIKNMGTNGRHVKLYLKSNNNNSKFFEAVWFNIDSEISFDENSKIDLLVNLQLDKWNGDEKIIFNVVDVKESA